MGQSLRIAIAVVMPLLATVVVISLLVHHRRHPDHRRRYQRGSHAQRYGDDPTYLLLTRGDPRRTPMVNDTRDTNKCCCRNVRYCEITVHKPGLCAGVVAANFWTFRWEYYCALCREYEWCGSKTRGYI